MNLIFDIRNQLLKEKDEAYCHFVKKLCITTQKDIIGVKMNTIQHIAKNFNIYNIREYIFNEDIKYYEEMMLRGILIGHKHNSIAEVFTYISHFITSIDCWAICDSTCASIKVTKKNIDAMWKLLQQYIHSQQEYVLRFVIVMYLNYYIPTKYLPVIFQQIEKLNYNYYYINTAIAWFISKAYTLNKTLTLEYISTSRLNTFILRKSLQKIKDSYQITQQDKDIITAIIQSKI